MHGFKDAPSVLKATLPADDDLLKRIQRPEFTSISGDMALEGQDPHAVGVAIKGRAGEATPEPVLLAKRRGRKSSARGFGSL